MHWLIKHIQQHDKKPALVYLNDEFSYFQLTQQVNQYLDELQGKIEAGQVVAILSDYSFYSISLFLTLLEKKCIIVPIVSNVEAEINERLEESKSDWVVQISKTDLIIKKQESSEKHILINKVIEKGDAGLILFSSGSTGKPKAMIHNLDNLVNTYKNRKSKKLTMLVFLMFDHIGGLNTLLNSLVMGAKIVIADIRDADKVSKLIETHRVNVLPTSPTFLNLLLIANVVEKYDLSSLKIITYGTEPMPESLLKRLKTSFPRTKFLQTFGTSETGIAQTTSRSSGSLEMKLDDPNQEYKIVNGELWLRSKTQVLGYLNADMDSFTDDGWFKTGDLVEEIDDGYIKIIGRNKEIINVGGEKVLPAEVESVLLEMNEILDVLAYGEQNAITGQSVVVDIVIKDGVEQKQIKKNIRKYCREKLDNYKIPTKININNTIKHSARFKKIRINKV
jgi:acyl-coenzyme A synthetase/AMP-(fatty) acid ligase